LDLVDFGHPVEPQHAAALRGDDILRLYGGGFTVLSSTSGTVPLLN